MGFRTARRRDSLARSTVLCRVSQKSMMMQLRRRVMSTHASMYARTSGMNGMGVTPVVPHLHNLIGDFTQPGLDGSTGVKAVALRQLAPGEVVFREKGEVYLKPSMHS